MNVEQRETLTLAYEQPFHTSQKHQVAHKPFENIWENVATEYCAIQLWQKMTEPPEVQPISHNHPATLIMLKYLI